MTKDQKRIKTLEDDIKNLREEILRLAMRPVYVPYAQPTVNPLNPMQPGYTPPYTITYGQTGNVQICN